jgi:hypothetical protein
VKRQRRRIQTQREEIKEQFQQPRGEARAGPPPGLDIAFAKPKPTIDPTWIGDLKPLAIDGVSEPVAADPRSQDAIARGIDYLKASLTVDQTLGDPNAANNFHLRFQRDPKQPSIALPAGHPGIPPFVGLTLLECGVPASDATIQKAALLTRRAAPDLSHCYSLSVAILFLDRLGDARDRELIRQLALLLIGNQSATGGWAYSCLPLHKRDRDQLLAFLRDPEQRPGPKVAALPIVQAKPGEVARPGPTDRDDNSNTQFVILALWAAGKHDVPVTRSLALAEARFRGSQNADGSWDYARWTPEAPLRHSTTCAGLIAIAAGRAASNLKAERGLVEDPVVSRSLDHLGRIVGLPALPPAQATGGSLSKPRGKLFGGDAGGDLYLLWSIERVAVVYGLRTVGGRDWYPWGSRHILDAQRNDGSWREWYPGIPDTCFALLFLKRAHVARDLTARLEALGSIKESKGTPALVDREEKLRALGHIKLGPPAP